LFHIKERFDDWKEKTVGVSNLLRILINRTMSRIGKHQLPAGVTVEVKDGIITVKGKMVATQEFSDVTVTVETVKVQVV
jgi:hypothetical protein